MNEPFNLSGIGVEIAIYPCVRAIFGPRLGRETDFSGAPFPGLRGRAVSVKYGGCPGFRVGGR